MDVRAVDARIPVVVRREHLAAAVRAGGARATGEADVNVKITAARVRMGLIFSVYGRGAGTRRTL
jgi:hypothetical protein